MIQVKCYVKGFAGILVISGLSLHQDNQFDHPLSYLTVVDFALADRTTFGRVDTKSLRRLSFTPTAADQNVSENYLEIREKAKILFFNILSSTLINTYFIYPNLIIIFCLR